MKIIILIIAPLFFLYGCSLFASIILLWGMLRRGVPIINLSLVLFVACAVFSIIASQTGESAEHYLKGLNAIDENNLERHVSAANIANYSMIVVGTLALITLIYERIRNVSLMPYTILISPVVVLMLMATTGKPGGEIIYKEIRNNQLQIKI